jgi:carboxypeptidase C (cathepsin A)
MGSILYLPAGKDMPLRSINQRALELLCSALMLSAVVMPAWGVELTADMITNEPIIAPVETHHAVRVGGEQIRYKAAFVETLLSENGRPLATISATSYVREDVRSPAQRPVLFAFNGGPGASSSPLHFGALGTRRWAEERGPGGVRQIVENPYSLIDVCDLVFIDPVGTGFSRVRPDVDAVPYWSPAGDAQSVLSFIRTWLREQRRTESPVFITGESYGGFRLATFAKDLEDLKVVGIILVSPLLDASGTADAIGNDLPFVLQLPTLAAGAWYHEKVPRNGKSIEQFYEEAVAFAQSDYVVALQHGSALPAAKRSQIAARMSALIGLPAAAIEAANLRIESETFLRSLLAERELLVGRLDMRVTAPKPPPPKDPNRPPAADDPALGLKGSNVIKSEPIKTYLERDLKVSTQRDYLSLTLDVNFRWNWQGSGRGPSYYVNPTGNIAVFMSKQPRARLLLLGGYFDLATPVLGPRYALTHAGVPLDRVTIRTFAAGHSPFEGEANLARFSEVVRAFVRGE